MTNANLTESGHRPLYLIADEIAADWKAQGKSPYAAVPYLEAMKALVDIKDNYIAESGRMIVAYFLGNVQTWRGETARRIKAELRAITK